HPLRDQLRRTVSILARPEGRAPRELRLDTIVRTTKFQSSPGPKAGRHGQRGDYFPPGLGFQSSPGPKAGRHVYTSSVMATHAKFQSSPGPKAGRHDVSHVGKWCHAGVSILARPEGRAPPS